MLLATFLLGAALQTQAPPLKPKSLMGPPSPHRIHGAETVWVIGRFLPDLDTVDTKRSKHSLLEQFHGVMSARLILPELPSVDPLRFIPGERYGGNSLPKSYPLGAPLTGKKK